MVSDKVCRAPDALVESGASMRARFLGGMVDSDVGESERLSC